MKRVFAHDNIMIVYNIKNILQRAGLSCEVRNDMVSSAAGEVPPIEVWPEIRVAEDDADQAEVLIDRALHGDPSETSWFCEHCSEENAPAFETCWKCGHDCRT